MSIRIKVFLIIAAIVVVITVSSVAISISVAQNQILKTLEVDMRLVTSLLNEYVSGEIDRLKTNAASVAQALKNTPVEERQPILVEQVAAYEHFQAITVFNSAGKVEISFGVGAATEEIAQSEYGRQVYEGQRVISTSHIDSSGNLVFFVFAPLDDQLFQVEGEQNFPRIVACTVPGLFFSKQLNRFLIWDSGNIAMQDQEGTIIANVHAEWVMDRLNFLELAKQDKRYESAARVMQRIIEGGQGTDRFTLEGVDVLTAYTPITASEQGWSLAVIAPIKESPFYQVWVIIVIAGIVFLCLGLVAAAFGSGIIVRLYQRQ